MTRVATGPCLAVVVFPGSNCDRDAAWAWEHVTGGRAGLVWHESPDLGECDAVLLPGGFAHGDYLRAGALCRFSPAMAAVAAAAADGVPVLGICNGFQILCEAGLLPGALGRNVGLSFVCEPVRVRVERGDTPWTAGLSPGEVLTLPIAHGEGRYCPPAEGYGSRLRRQVVFRYCDAAGRTGGASNPNGSLDDIAGLCNDRGNVVGLMPHPERAADARLGGADGAAILQSAARFLAAACALPGDRHPGAPDRPGRGRATEVGSRGR